MICENEETRLDVADMLKRVSSSMSALEVFSDKMADLDEDDPNLTSKVAPMVERLSLTLIMLYPNGPSQMQADIKSIGDFSVKETGGSEK